jgi:perosamine synthetase
MSVFPRYLAPAGAPISTADLLAWSRSIAGAQSGGEALRQALCARFGDHHFLLTSTGRAGMTLLLRALRRVGPADRDEVVVPSYTCYSVAASAVKAGLKVRIVDIDPETLDFDRQALAETDLRRALALVATNLYGWPNDMAALTKVTRDRGIFLIDDAAQSMGATVDGRLSGLWGDAGLFSFDKGKNVCAIDGGVVVTASADIAEALRADAASLSPPPFVTSAGHVAKALAYYAMLRPAAYGLATRVPGLSLGRTIFTTGYPVAGPDPRLSALAAVMLPRLDEFLAVRRANANALLRLVQQLPGVRTIRAGGRATPAYLRLPLLMDSEQTRDSAIATLTGAGIGATRSYPLSLADVPELQPSLVPDPRPLDGGRRVARTIVTLPTHPFVTAEDVRRIGARLQATLTSAREAAAPAARAS